jgi:hypothetical protein
MRTLPLFLSMPLLAACTTSQTDVLAPYTLANGQYMQDVVTVATDKKGAAPIVTVVNTYDVSRQRAELVSHDAASSPGLATVIAGGLAGSIPNAVATVAAAALREPDRINIDNADCNTSQQGTSIGGEGGEGGDGGDGGLSVGVGVGGDANANGGAGGAATGGNGAAGGAGGAGGGGGTGGVGGADGGAGGAGAGGGAGGNAAAGGSATSTGGLANAVGGAGSGFGGNASGGAGAEGGDAGAFTGLVNGNC